MATKKHHRSQEKPADFFLGALCVAMRPNRAFCRRCFRSADSLVRVFLPQHWQLADKAVRAPLVAAWLRCALLRQSRPIRVHPCSPKQPKTWEEALADENEEKRRQIREIYGLPPEESPAAPESTRLPLLGLG